MNWDKIEFKNEKRFLSNMYKIDVDIPGEGIYKSTEHYYQSKKFKNKKIEEYIKDLEEPTMTKKYVRHTIKQDEFKNEINPNFDAIKLGIMLNCVYYKFKNNLYLREELLNVKDKIIEEKNDWGDIFWGTCDGKGENNLGKILTMLRNKFEQEKISYYANNVTEIEKDEIFVFGSNPEGRHGAGSALIAKKNFGAIYGKGRGFQGNSYALITKNLTPNYIEKKDNNEIKEYKEVGEKSVSLEEIEKNIIEFYENILENEKTNNVYKRYYIAYKKDSKNFNGYSSNEIIVLFLKNLLKEKYKKIRKKLVFSETFKEFIENFFEKYEIDLIFGTNHEYNTELLRKAYKIQQNGGIVNVFNHSLLLLDENNKNNYEKIIKNTNYFIFNTNQDNNKQKLRLIYNLKLNFVDYQIDELSLNQLDRENYSIYEKYILNKEENNEIQNIEQDFDIYTNYFSSKNRINNSLEVSISRFPPKWFNKDLDLKILAPSIQLLTDFKEQKINEEDYIKRFNEEMEKVDFKNVLNILKNEMKKQNKTSITLNCFEKTGDFCHRHLLSDKLRILKEVSENKETEVKENNLKNEVQDNKLDIVLTNDKSIVNKKIKDKQKKLLVDTSNYVIRHFYRLMDFKNITGKIETIIKKYKDNVLDEKITTEIEENVKTLFQDIEMLLYHNIFKSIMTVAEKNNVALQNIIFLFDSKSYIYDDKDLMDYLIEMNSNNKNYKGHRKEEINSNMSNEEKIKIITKNIKKEFSKKIMKKLYDYLENTHIKNIKINKLEADHLIGLLSKGLSDNKIQHIILSKDEDFKQLLTSEYIELFIPDKNDFKIIKNFDKEQSQKDLLLKIIIGDSSDNIPTIYTFLQKYNIRIQFGEKTIEGLIHKYKEYIFNENKLLDCINLELEEKIKVNLQKEVKEKIKEENIKIQISSMMLEKLNNFILNDDENEKEELLKLIEKKDKENNKRILDVMLDVYSKIIKYKEEINKTKNYFQKNKKIISFEEIPEDLINLGSTIIFDKINESKTLTKKIEDYLDEEKIILKKNNINKNGIKQ